MTDRRLVGAILAALLAFLLPAAAAPPSAHACGANQATVFGISPGCVDQQVSAPPTVTSAAPPFTQAGGHPFDVTFAFYFNAPSTPVPPHEKFWPPEALKDFSFALPPGYAANAESVPSCTMPELMETDGQFTAPACLPASQVGAATVEIRGFGEILPSAGIPIYKLTPTPDSPVRFGFTILGLTMVLRGELGDAPERRLILELHDINQGVDLVGGRISLWGVPADPRHTPERSCSHQLISGEPGGSTCAAGVQPRAFLRLPTVCGAPPTTLVTVDSWEHPGAFATTSVTNHLPPGLRGDPTDLANYPLERPGLDMSAWGAPQGLTGCDLPPFDPSIEVDATSREAGAPTGLEFRVAFPQQGLSDPESIAESDMKSLRIELPDEMSVNPSMATGLQACAADRVQIGTQAPATCPDASKLGTAELRSPMLAGPVAGSIYLAAPKAAPVSAVPVYVVAEGEGVVVKLSADLRLNENGGAPEAVIADAPQVPLKLLRLRFFGGERALFLNPTRCGAASFVAHFEPWSGLPAVDSTATSPIDAGLGGGPCPLAGHRAFAPTVKGGSTDARAGRPSPFSMAIARPFGNQQIKSFDVALPAGLAASLGDIPLCPDAAIAAAESDGRAGEEELGSPSCPATSRVGALRMALGAGERPLSLDTGQVYLAGQYNGAPFSLVAIAPELAGSLDFGTLVLRMPLELDKRDGRVRIRATVPGTERGLRLDVRTISLTIDRPGFMLNPTSCKKMALEASFVGDEGGRATASAPFQLRSCGALPFKPSLRVTATGGRPSTHHGANPGLVATISMPGRDANLRRAMLVMPAAQQLDPAHLTHVCTRRQLASRQGCPQSTAYGRASLRTPILDAPLRGPVFLRASKHRFPDVLAKLSGPVELELTGRMTFAHGRVQMLFDQIPDVPLSRFTLRMAGGKRGVLVNNRDLCGPRPFARAALSAHSGRSKTLSAPLAVSCG